MAGVVIGVLATQMFPTIRAPPRQSWCAGESATYSAREHNCDFVPGNKIAILHLGEEQAVLTAAMATFFIAEKGSERGQPFLTAAQQIFGGQRIGQLLQTGGIAAFQKGIGGLLEVDALLTHPVGQPLMLV